MTGTAHSGEWRAGWPLPFIGMLGMTGTSIVNYTAGVMVQAFEAEFGWTRSAYMSGLVVITLTGMITLPFIGRVADRIGPRPLALAGIVAYVITGALVGVVVDGQVWQWWLMCLALGLVGALISPIVWTMAVASRFMKSRGLALAVVLSGLGLAGAIWPLLATFYIEELGWRAATAALYATWGMVIFPLTLFFFFSGREAIREDAAGSPTIEADGMSYRQAIRSRPFVVLVVAGLLFAVCGFAMNINLVPMLRNNGLSPTAAAAVAANSGLCAILGRVLAGWLLDRFPPRPVAVVSFVAPVGASLLLLAAGTSIPLSIAAAVVLGLGVGAEMDITTYLATRYFGMKNFGSLYGLILSTFAISAGLGPLLASLIYDSTGSYRLFLWITIPVLVLSTMMVAALPKLPSPSGAERP